MTKRFIAGLISLILIISALPAMAAPIGEEFYGKIAEMVIIEPGSAKMIKYGRVENFTENNVGTAHYADEILVVPIRFLAETFYGQLNYDNISRKCRVSFERGVIEYEVGSRKATVLENETELSIAPFLKDGTTYVPLVDFITPLGMSYLTGDNGITVISPINNMDKSYFTGRVFEKIYETMHTSASEEVTIYVSTTGKSDGDGTKENPLDSIYSARDYIRELKKDGVERKYKVLFEEGIYSLDKTVEFESQDSGSPVNPIEYAAAPGADVKFTSGYSLDTWEKYDENIWRVQLPVPQKDCWLLSEGDKLATKAKYPNEGYLKLKADTPSAGMRSFHYTEHPEIDPKPDLQIGFYPGGKSGAWMWSWWYRYVVSYDKENKRIVMNDGTFDGNKTYVLGTNTKYVIYNALELIDIPGELYYSSQENYLYYYPYDESKLSEVIIPRAIDLFHFQGASADELVRNITLRDITIDGLDFYHDNFYVDNYDKSILAYISYDMDGLAVELDNTSGIHFDGCQFKKIGYRVFSGGGIYTNIRNCTFEEIGERAYTSGKFSNLENCYFYNSGFVSLTACAIYINKPYARVAHNRITNMRRSGIQFNGQNQGSVAEFNELDNCMWSSQDGAAIYTNNTRGGVERNNILRDIDSRYGVMTALYLDDRTKDFKAYNNQIYNMNLMFSHPSEIMAGLSQKSQRNEIYNNVFADLNSGRGNTFNKQTWDTIDSQKNYNNVWYNCYDRVRGLFQMYSTVHLHDKLFKKFGGNMFWNEIGSYTINVLGISSVDDMKQIGDGDLGHKELVGVKPEFMNEAERDYRMRYDCMAYAQGFTDTNISDTGLKEDFKFGPKEMVLDRLYMKEKGSFTDSATILLASGESKQLELSAREVQIQMKFKPDMKYITFASDNTDVATVSADGVIKGIGYGKAHIVATYDDGKVKKSTDVYVFVDDFAIAQYISPENTTELYLAESENFGTIPFIYAKTKLGRVLAINTDKHEFASANDDVAIAKKNGKIIGKKTGQTEITLSSSVADAKVEPYKIKINTVKDFYTTLKSESPYSILKKGDRVDIKTIAIAKRNNLFEEIPTKLVSTDDSIIKIVEEDGTRYIEAVGTGSAEVVAIYDTVPNNQMTKTVTYSVVEGEDEIYAGLKFREISGGTMESGIRKIENGHVSFFTTGADVYAKNDEFTYMYKEVEGDTDIVVTIDALQNIGDTSTSIGPMFRITDDTGSHMIHYRIRKDGKLLIAWRDEAKPECGNVKSENVSLPVTIKLERKGNTFNCYVFRDDSWSLLMTRDVEMPKSVVAGIGAFSHQREKTADFEISNLRITEKRGTAE